MYLEPPEFRQVLTEVRMLCQHPDSRLWIDHVTEAVFGMDSADVTSFLASMARLGERFVTGFSDAGQFSGSCKWDVASSVSAADVLGGGDIVHQEYRFSLLQPHQVEV
ncbi:hypothetical protein [Rhizobium leguminosarum]